MGENVNHIKDWFKDKIEKTVKIYHLRLYTLNFAIHSTVKHLNLEKYVVYLAIRPQASDFWERLQMIDFIETHLTNQIKNFNQINQ